MLGDAGTQHMYVCMYVCMYIYIYIYIYIVDRPSGGSAEVPVCVDLSTGLLYVCVGIGNQCQHTHRLRGLGSLKAPRHERVLNLAPKISGL